jgi:hypothetical protein
MTSLHLQAFKAFKPFPNGSEPIYGFIQVIFEGSKISKADF